MELIATRKIMIVGSSIGITLPPEVLEQFNLKRGDEVAILTNGYIIVAPREEAINILLKPRKSPRKQEVEKNP